MSQQQGRLEFAKREESRREVGEESMREVGEEKEDEVKERMTYGTVLERLDAETVREELQGHQTRTKILLLQALRWVNYFIMINLHFLKFKCNLAYEAFNEVKKHNDPPIN